MFLLVNECIKYIISLVRGSEHSNFCQLLNFYIWEILSLKGIISVWPQYFSDKLYV